MNTAAGVILPGLCGASTIFFFRQYMIGLPKELLPYYLSSFLNVPFNINCTILITSAMTSRGKYALLPFRIKGNWYIPLWICRDWRRQWMGKIPLHNHSSFETHYGYSVNINRKRIPEITTDVREGRYKTAFQKPEAFTRLLSIRTANNIGNGILQTMTSVDTGGTDWLWVAMAEHVAHFFDFFMVILHSCLFKMSTVILYFLVFSKMFLVFVYI